MTATTTQSMGMLADAVALQESGILVAGMTVTDLSSGYVAAGEAATQHPDYLLYNTDADGAGSAAGDAGADVRFKRTDLSLGRLEELYELVDEVVQQRYADPEPSSMNPREPRMRFPFGVGMRHPEIVIAGAHADVVARYLRLMGLRARPLEMELVWKVAAELEEARAGLEELMYGVVDDVDGTAIGAAEDVAGDSEDGAAGEIAAEPSRGEVVAPRVRWVRPVFVTVAVLICLMGGAMVGWSLFSSGRVQPESVAQAEATTDQPSEKGETMGETQVEEPPAEFDNHRRAGEEPEVSAERAQIPVAIAVPGWARVAATQGQEEFRNADPGMRVLVAAKPTPLLSQGELDAAVQSALTQHPDVQVVSTSPVSYVERFPESTTVWHVRWVNGHQMSVGCQYRQVTAERERECDAVVRTARPE
ncbi:type VII secretion-associated protein [Corynebacterium falsenii]|uniref:type VII secretion-associated protein n=1 Tax=Corynebacterium falsenii TaxID=108486 RepID=UPI001CCB5CB8|nr:type VII secretion-associated protein [Corynebacterium falsenii]UBI07407.1 type VII secretion-associated protein [Corynebacterium falsenii]